MTPPKGKPFKKGQSGNPGGRPKEVAEVRELALSKTPKTIDILMNIAEGSESDAARVAAIKEIHDRGLGKATQAVEVSGKDGDDIRVVIEKLPKEE